MTIGLPILLALAIGVVFWRVIGYPFIQDDWGVLNSIADGGPAAFLREGLSPAGKLLYRPGSTLYFLAAHQLFGLNPIPYHLTALVLHFITSLLIVFIMRAVIFDWFLAWMVGFLYAASVPVHLDPLLWCVGINDVGGTFFFSLSLLLVIRGRFRISAVAFLVAISMKESIVALLPVYVAYALLVGDGEKTLFGRMRSSLAKLWPQGLVLAAYIIVKTQAPSPLALPEAHPYKVRLVGVHVLRNVCRYFVWGLDAISPVKGVRMGTREGLVWLRTNPTIAALAAILVVVVLGLFALLWAARARGKTRGEVFRGAALPLFWGVWLAFGIGPFLFLPNHSYRYYLLYAFTPFLVLVVGFVAGALRGWRHSKRLVPVILTVFVGAHLLSSARLFQTMDRKGVGGMWLSGTNDLVRKGATVEIVRAGLREAHPTLPRGAVLIFGGVDVWAFDKDSGPRLWYGDTSLGVYEEKYLRFGREGAVIEGSPGTQAEAYQGIGGSGRLLLDPERTFIFRLENRRLREYRLTDMYGGAE